MPLGIITGSVVVLLTERQVQLLHSLLYTAVIDLYDEPDCLSNEELIDLHTTLIEVSSTLDYDISTAIREGTTPYERERMQKLLD